MSIVPHGISRLYCVWKCSSGLRNKRSPLIHILEGEKVWHQVTNPAHAASAFARWHSAVASAALERGGNLPGVGRNLFQGGGAVKMLAARDKPDFVLFQVNHAGRWS